SRYEPAVDVDQWSFVVDGLVEQPLRFRYDEIRQLESYETYLTLECISNPVGGSSIGNAHWRGTRLRPLLERARIRPQAVYAVLYGADAYTTGHPVEQILGQAHFLPSHLHPQHLHPPPRFP